MTEPAIAINRVLSLPVNLQPLVLLRLLISLSHVRACFRVLGCRGQIALTFNSLDRKTN